MTTPHDVYWRTLDERSGRVGSSGAPGQEFPPGAAEPPDGMSRRSFVQLLGASLALAGLGACLERPRQKILPYVSSPPELTPGVAQHYATAMTLGGWATGLLVESHEGRPTKIEGNPDHPASLGASGVWEQASVLQLYDPHRAREVRQRGSPSSWALFRETIAPQQLERAIGRRGEGLHFLLEPTASPLVAELISRVQERYPGARFHFYAPLASAAASAGARAAFGRPLQPVYDFTRTDVVLAVDADFLAGMPFHLRYAHDFAIRRRIASPTEEMNRLYAVECAPTPTGTLADHRLRARPSEMPALLAGVLAETTSGGAIAGRVPEELASMLARWRGGAAPYAAWARAAAEDLAAHAGRSAVIVGERQPAAVHAMAYALNAALGNAGRTLRYVESPLLGPADAAAGLVPLVDAMRAGDVAWLVVLGGNPVYTAPADVDVAGALGKVGASVYHGLYRNETASRCWWFLPARHYLETWGDARAYDGTTSLVQPLIAPLFGGLAETDVLAAFAGDGRDSHELLRDTWRRRWAGDDFDQRWDAVLQRGVVPDSAAPEVASDLRWDAVATAVSQLPAAVTAEGDHTELAFAPDASVYDGRFANNPWLQELPDPITTLCWDNAALLSPRSAERLGIATGQFVEISFQARHLTIPALVLPGHADGAITLPLGYGRAEGDEQVAALVGSNAYAVRTADAPFAAAGAAVRPLTGAGAPSRRELALTQGHWSLSGRPIILATTLDQYQRTPDFAKPERTRSLSLYQPPPLNAGDQWAMTIDLSACTGCSACVIACQAENNVPVVGRDDVLRNREMHWLRIDRYHAGTADDPVMIAQPMLCQHCEKAPCEYVCPVSATVHSPDGLNEMIYNRCIGTRFCSNNCPYKVRRFNWFDYNAEVAETERMAKNPDVTVRARGVMEKCTFCVQRVRRAQIDARLEDRGLRPGEVRTACQQACPMGAIVFGSLTNPDDEVVRWRENGRAYLVLHELGTEPRVRYLARVRNPNRKLEGESSDA